MTDQTQVSRKTPLISGPSQLHEVCRRLILFPEDHALLSKFLVAQTSLSFAEFFFSLKHKIRLGKYALIKWYIHVIDSGPWGFSSLSNNRDIPGKYGESLCTRTFQSQIPTCNLLITSPTLYQLSYRAHLKLQKQSELENMLVNTDLSQQLGYTPLSKCYKLSALPIYSIPPPYYFLFTC